ncbi:hypothetical protein [Pseudomonas sp. 18058]|uniref:hypothetical protein n=1 Tax=Pseudomonas sp. 18058 TaxID=2681406 RepID=UPI00135681E0|nr:hypothetical protein [Pseudomonas sp. 18058]
MPAGLQTFDANGMLVRDVTQRMGNIITSSDSGVANSSRLLPEIQNAAPLCFVTTDADYFSGFTAIAS